MAEPPAWRYSAAVLASLVSTLAWVGVALGVLYALSRALTGPPVDGALPAAVVVLLAVAVLFARVERRLYERA